MQRVLTVCNTGMPVRLTEMQSNTIGLIIYRYYATACRRRRCFKATAVLQTANDSEHGPTAAQTCVKVEHIPSRGSCDSSGLMVSG